MDKDLIYNAMKMMKDEMGIKGFVIESRDEELLFEVLEINSAIKQMEEVYKIAEKHPDWVKK